MPYTILVVDDNVLIRNLIVGILSRDGFIVHEAASAEDALVRIIDSYPDLLIVDYHMDKVNGADLIRILRRTNRFANVPIIGLSGISGSETLLMDAGATVYIAKPIRDESITSVIRKYLF
jgi:two-component system phosphate regulon response regulator PhoB